MAEQALVPSQPKAQLVTGGSVAAIIPKSIEEVFRLAGAMVSSGMAPSSLKTPEQAMVAILAGAELGLPPFQALQSFAVVSGRPCLWGDGLMAVVRSNGFKVKEWLEGDGDDLTAWCTVTRPDNGEEITRSFSIGDARKANLWGKQGPWQTNPKRMLQMRARGFACRDGAADVLRGFQLREEVEDYADVPQRGAPPPVRADVRARLEARQVPAEEGFTSAFNPDRAESEHAEAEFVERAEAVEEIADALAHDADTGEIIESDLPGHADEPDDDFPGDRPTSFTAEDEFDVQAWARDLIADEKQLQTVEAIEAFFADKEATRRYRALELAAPVLAKSLVSALNGRKKAAASKAAG